MLSLRQRLPICSGSRQEKERWQELPQAVRKDIEAAVSKQQALYQEYQDYLQRSQVRHALGGAVFAMFICWVSHFLYWMTWPWDVLLAHSLPDFALGGIAGYFVNRRQGSEYTGMLSFGFSWIVSVIIKYIFSIGIIGHLVKRGDITSAFYVATLAGHLGFTLVGGYLFGLSLRFDREFWRSHRKWLPFL